MKHQCIHIGEHPYSCEVCNKEFSHQSSVIRHKRLHSDEHPYVCHVCNKAYSDKNSLKKCLQIHNGGSPYRCEVCNKVFSYKSHLIIYRSTHILVSTLILVICVIRHSVIRAI